MPRPCGTIIAANSPCAARPPISVPAEPAAAHSAEHTVKPASPARNILRRPTMSPSRAPVIISTEKASV